MLISTINHSHIGANRAEADQKQRVRNEAIFIAEQQGVGGIAAWLKAIRLEKLLKEIEQIDLRKTNALGELKALTKSVEELIASDRGGEKGIHGFIGERAQVYITRTSQKNIGSQDRCY